MLHKHNADRRHHIPKMAFKIKNWPEYEAGLRRRGSLPLWIEDGALDHWQTLGPGGQARYADAAIQTTLMVRTAFKLAWRQTEGLLASVITLMDLRISVPDHTTISRRAVTLPVIQAGSVPHGPLHLLIDSTGLQVYGVGQWLEAKHGAKSRRKWRKLHLVVDAGSCVIVAQILTDQDADDPSQVAPLLNQIESLSGHIPRSSLRSSDLLPFYHQYPAACCGDFLFFLSVVPDRFRHAGIPAPVSRGPAAGSVHGDPSAGHARQPARIAARQMMLPVEDLHRSFGGVAAVAGASFGVAEGSITALIGPNGAGKTTVFNLVSGFLRAGSGKIHFADRRIDGLPGDTIARGGLVRTFQTPRVLTRMRVRENLLLAGRDQPGEIFAMRWIAPRRVAARERQVRRRADDLLALLRLDHLADDYAGTLSGGQRKLLELGRALMTEPRMILLDEPMAGIAPVLAAQLLDHIRTFRARQGVTVFLIEHDMEMVMSASDRVIVMDEGRVIAEGRPEAVQRDEHVIEAYLGRTAV
jgi:neutral amino acid transport system ATP-binding protein